MIKTDIVTSLFPIKLKYTQHIFLNKIAQKLVVTSLPSKKTAEI